MATLAKGGRTNTLGFVLRLLGGIPFLFVGFRLYGVDEMGRFAAAFVVIELFALVCALGEKRGLAQRLTEGDEDAETSPVNLVFDGMLTSLVFSVAACALLIAFPWIIFPSGTNSDYDMWMVAAIPAFALTEVCCSELREPTLLMRIGYACSTRGVYDAKAKEYFVFVTNTLRVARLTGDIPKEEKLSVGRVAGHQKKTPAMLHTLFKNK